jgi:hypothetical protein
MSNQFFDIKNGIKEFLKLDEEIRSLSKAKCDRLRKKEKISKEITSFYKLNNIRTLDLNFDGNKHLLEMVETERHPSVNQKFLRNALVKYCNNDKIVDNMIDHILYEREQNSSSSFKLKVITPLNKKITKNAMELIKDNEKSKIQERFMKLAEYAIAKDSIKTIKPSIQELEPLQIENVVKDNLEIYKNASPSLSLTQQKLREDIPQKQRTISVGHSVHEEEIDYDEENSYIETDNDNTEYNDEDEVDLDELPIEETGYTDDPPQIEEKLNKNNTIKNLIYNKLDSLNSENITGSIPVPKSQLSHEQLTNILKDLEIKAINSWKTLDTLSSKYPNLEKWLLLQKDKIKLLKVKAQTEKDAFNEMYSKINQLENEYTKIYFSEDINKFRSDIINYLQFRFKNS